MTAGLFRIHLGHLVTTITVAAVAMPFDTQVKRSTDAHAPVTLTAIDVVLMSRLLLRCLG